MGTRIDPPEKPPPRNVGTTCANCWGPGAPFGDDWTPDSIRISFSGINKNIDWEPWMLLPHNEEVELAQDGFAPCQFEFVDDDFIITCIFHLTWTEVILLGIDGGFQFLSPSSSPCSEFVFNERNIRYVNGSALITIPELIL